MCRTERVLRYVDRPEAVLAEMVRLTRPGGFVLAFDFDSDQTVVDAPDSVLRPDYERLPACHEAMVAWAMITLMTRRLARLS